MRLPLVIAVLCWALRPVPPEPVPANVAIPAPDGVALGATYVPGTVGGPAVLLLHSCNTDRRSWDPVLGQLGRAGLHALSLDYRGYGESAGPRVRDVSPAERRQLVDLWPGDIDAVLAWLGSQPGVDRTRIGIGGSSCGVDQALRAAARHAEVRSVVLLAGPANRAGRQYLLGAPWLPLLASAAADDRLDNDPQESMRWLTEISGNPRNEFLGYPDGGHGTEIFGPHPDLARRIVSWFRDTLVTAPAGPDATVAPISTPARELWKRLELEDDVAGAARIFREAHERDPRAFLFPESVMNQAGYARLQAGDAAGAVTLFTLNTDAFPASANAWDSLGDAYLAAGDNARALDVARRCLTLLAADRSDEETKKAIRASAEGKIAKLTAGTPVR